MESMFDRPQDWLCLIPVVAVVLVTLLSRHNENDTGTQAGPYDAKRDARIERTDEQQKKQAGAKAAKLQKDNPLYQARDMQRKGFEKMNAAFTRDLDDRKNHHKMRDAFGRLNDIEK